jgi:hypothetical protein
MKNAASPAGVNGHDMKDRAHVAVTAILSEFETVLNEKVAEIMTELRSRLTPILRDVEADVQAQTLSDTRLE